MFEYESRLPGANSSGSSAAEETSRRAGITARGLRATALRHGSSCMYSGIPLVWLSRCRTRICRPCAEAARQQVLDGPIEAEPALGDELQGHGRDEALGHAPDPEAIARTRLPGARDISSSCGDDGAVAVLLEERDHAGDVAVRDDAVCAPLEHGSRRRRRDDEDGTGESERRDEAHVPNTPRAVSLLQTVTSGPLGVY